MEEKKFDDKLQIVVSGSAYDKDIQRTNMGATKKPFNAHTAKMMREVESLDRDDDFSRLKIAPVQYKKLPGSEYGIPVTKGKNDEVIYAHQRKAAEAFLKELRGFGLLADVVGSGKTFEAGVVLSELAARDKMKSLLVIVPDQVYDNWLVVLEQFFGLGKDSLLRAVRDDDIMQSDLIEETPADGGSMLLRPVRPVIVRTDDFVKWGEDIKKYLFDVIVVDEAHHLCVEEGKYAKAMKLLSLLMETKKRANSTYCVLLSATPHSGNLEHMFRLWYFIRCKGGNPTDFDEKDDKNRTEEYRSEKDYYKTHVCRGATTVQEFIEKVKVMETERTFKPQLDAYLGDKQNEYYNGMMSEKLFLLKGFFMKNPDIRRKINNAIANAYHNGVLRSIMIRQPNNQLAKKKYAQNYFFFPMATEPSLLKTTGLKGESVDVDCKHLDGGRAVKVDGRQMSVADYVKDNAGDKTMRAAYADFVCQKIINQIGMTAPIFEKQNSGIYYWEQLDAFPEEVTPQIIPYKYVDGDKFTHKMKLAETLLKKHANERVLVFFDYEERIDNPIYDRFEKALTAVPELAKRVIVGTGANKEETKNKFEQKDDAILIVKDAGFTEGANLQSSSVIINFQVTPDPLAMDQRIGRIFRLGQQNDVTIYSLANMNDLEGYVLAYFSRIGLMSSNSGDATIIAGSNNERMVTVRCSVCGRVELLSQEDYEKRKRDNTLFCKATERCCQMDKKGTAMEEITVYNFKCDTCDSVFERSASEEGYLCVSKNDDSKGIMCSGGDEGDRNIYCRKICAVSHCRRFKEDSKLKKCPALKYYKENKNVSDSELMLICETCTITSCSSECRISDSSESIAACSTCQYASCRPKPHVISFNEKWEATCPVCGESKYGMLKPVLAKTFATYIRGAWSFKHDNGQSFCENLGKEADKVADIKIILELDKMEG